MLSEHKIAVIIPALNEEDAIGKVISAIPNWVDDIIVVDNGSSDRTVEVARNIGARVIFESHRGYGAACLAGIGALQSPDIVVFLDGDFSDHPEQMDLLVNPIIDRHADMVIGSRVLGNREKGALTIQARFGNWLACHLINLFWKVKFTDLGPFRAIRYSSLNQLNMSDRGYGWTVEMQIKAARHKIAIEEVPAEYRRRIGKSKISGTIRGVIGAGTIILSTIFLYALEEWIKRRSARRKIIVFTRFPVPGETKTRLTPAFSPEEAAEIHRQMTFHTICTARNCQATLEVRYTGGTLNDMQTWLGDDLSYTKQEGDDLGQRMMRAFQENFAAGCQRAVIIGTDCPELTDKGITYALQSLKHNDLVVGPADDGGYYLIGLRRESAGKAIPALFTDIDWGTDRVLRKTLNKARQATLKVCQLTTLSDVDRPEDIDIWNRTIERSSAFKNSMISVIIPATNEEKSLPKTLKHLKRGKNIETILADGNSSDSTVNIAKRYGAKVISDSCSRAERMNKAAATANGEILLFVHADTILPQEYDKHIRRILSDERTPAGAFELRINHKKIGLLLIEHLANWRSRRLKLPYGDQGIFVRADVFRKIGGYRKMPIMEDFDLIRKLKKQGKIAIIPAPATTSSRRWNRLGIAKTTFINQIIIAGYYSGISPKKLASWYRSKTLL